VDWTEVEQKFKRAVDQLMIHDRQLLVADVHERTLTAQLAHYLSNEFPNWDVDCEYNRRGDLTKRLHWRDGPPGDQSEKVYPDIIIHRRNTNANLVVVEAKKDDGDVEEDEKRVAAFKASGDFAYEHGVLIRFVTRPNPNVELRRC
jgi:hypothetical protein